MELTAHQPVVALHQLAEHLLDRDATRQRVGVTAVGAEREITRFHCGRATGSDRFLAEREMTRALDQVLQEQVEGPPLGLANFDLHAIHVKARFLANVVVELHGVYSSLDDVMSIFTSFMLTD
jgi:hypothetical protein